MLRTTTLERALTLTLTEADLGHKVLGDQEEKPTKSEKEWPVLKGRIQESRCPQSHVKCMGRQTKSDAPGAQENGD